MYHIGFLEARELIYLNCGDTRTPKAIILEEGHGRSD